MNRSTTIKEESSWLRMAAIVVSAVLSIVLFTAYWNISDPLWGDYLRLAAFIFLSIAVIGYVSIRNSSLLITIEITDDHLLLFYKNNQKTVRKEQFDRSTVQKITATKKGKGWITSLLQPDDLTMKISFTDTDHVLFMLTFSDRKLYFNKKSIRTLCSFLSSHNITIDQ